MRMEILLLALSVAVGVVLLKSAAELATVLLAFFNFVFIEFLFWDRWTDKPKLEIKMEGKTKIVKSVHARRYAPKVSVLNKGRKDAYNCRVSVQVFNQKSGKKIEECPPSEFDLKSGEAESVSNFDVIAFNDNFVARISAETHKSKDNKIVEYDIRNDYDHIIFKRKTVQYLKFRLERLFKKYRNEWDTEFLVNELKNSLEPKIRTELIKKLEKIGDDKALEAIIDQLEHDTSDPVRDCAVVALGNIGNKWAVDPLLECLKEGKVNPWLCTLAITKIGDRGCVKKLIDIFRDRNIPSEIRKAAAKSLGEIGEKIKDETIEKALIGELKDFDVDVPSEVIEALGKVGGEKALKELKKIVRYHYEDILKTAIEKIEFRISGGGDNIE